jgi:hypothetical protein
LKRHVLRERDFLFLRHVCKYEDSYFVMDRSV